LKRIILSAFLAFFILCFFCSNSYAEIVVVESNGTLGFQNSLNEIVYVYVNTGQLNGSITLCEINSGGGKFRFNVQNDSNIVITFTPLESLVYFSPNGDIGLKKVTSGDSFNLTTSDDAYLIWNTPFYSPLPMMFIVGIVGLGCLFVGPWIIIDKIRKKEYEKALVTGFIITFTGFAFFVGWVFSG
jgi:hypothetical protein